MNILLLIICALLLIIALVYFFSNVPEGYEDENGFHVGRKDN